MKYNLHRMRHEQNNPVDVFGFGWCWDMAWVNGPTTTRDPVYEVGWAGTTVGGPEGDLAWGLDSEDSAITGNSVCMDTYLNALSEYNAAHPQTKSIFTTGPVEGFCGTGETGYQRYIKHQHIRQYVQNNGGILFDYADILTHNDAGEVRIVTWEGHEFPMIHTENTNDGSNYSGSDLEDLAQVGDGVGSHIGSEGCLKIGKAIWWMMARIAGWDGTNCPSDASLLWTK